MNKHIFRLLAAIVVLMFPCMGLADDGTVASNAVSMGTEFAVENGKEISDGELLVQDVRLLYSDISKVYTSSGSDTFKATSIPIFYGYVMDDDTDKNDWHYLDPPDWVAGNIKCTLNIYEFPNDNLIKSHDFTAHEYDSLNYERDGTMVSGTVDYSYSIDAEAGFYRIETILKDASGAVIEYGNKICYFKPNVTNLVDRGTIMSSYKYNSYVELCWYPTLDWNNYKVKSTSYRVYIYDQQFKDGSKSHGKPYVYDEVIEGHCSDSVKGTLLPYGNYTIYVECMSGGTVLETKKCLLQVKDQSYTYDWDVGKYVTPEPGEHATRQHAEGDKDMTSYTETLDANDLGGSMTKLTSGILTLDVDCSGASFTASANGDTLALNGSDDKWRFTQQALEILNGSGINQISLSMKSGISITIPTDLELSGYQYTKLRAQGLVSKDFWIVYKNGGLSVEVNGETFNLNGDGTLSKQNAEETAQ